MCLLIKVKGKCMMDYIFMVGFWLKYCGYLDNIFNNCFIGVINFFNGEMNKVVNYVDSENEVEYLGVLDFVCKYKVVGISIVVFGEENYGEGFFCEYVVMELCYLGVCVVIVKFFVCIYEINLKKQGMLAFIFVNLEDYEKVCQDDKIDIFGFNEMVFDKNLIVKLYYKDGLMDEFEVVYIYNQVQIDWVSVGFVLNKIWEELVS